MKTTILVLIISLLFGLADALRKLTIGTNYKLVSLFFNAGTILAPILFILYSLFKKEVFKYNPGHLIAALLAGSLAGLGGVLLFYALSKGLDISSTIPIIRILSISFVAVVGILIFREPFTLKLVIGLLLALSGVYLVLS